jgi:preprotein translocase subunit SecD
MTQPDGGETQATLTESGAATLKGFSSAHVGQKLAVVMNDHVIAAPVIRVAIDQEFEIDGFDKSDAEKLAQPINQKTAN